MTYQTICDELAAANEWLASLGIHERQDRFRQHLQGIERLEEARQSGTLDQSTQGEQGRLAMFSLTEAMELIAVHHAFNNDSPPGLRRRLRDALQAPADPAQESPDSNHARNIMFELNMASRLQAHHIPLSLPENPDVLCKLLESPVYIQCKRPFRERTIPDNIDDARYQLTRDLDRADNASARGVIAISVSRVFNCGDQLFAGADEDVVKSRLGDEVQALGESVNGSWNAIVDARIIGILFHVITPSHIQDMNLLTVAQQTVLFPIPGRTEPDVALMWKLAAAISD